MGSNTRQLSDDVEVLEEDAAIQQAQDEATRTQKGAPSLCEFIRGMIPRMSTNDVENAMALLANEADENAYGVATEAFIQLTRRINLKSISPTQLERIIVLWKSIPQQW